MSTDVQVPPKVDVGSDKHSRRRSKDTEKAHRRSSNFQNKKHKHDHKFRKRSQSFTSTNGKFFPAYKMRKKDFIIPPTKFLLGGNITDPLNLNSLQDEEINRAMNAVTPKSSPLPTPRHRKGVFEVIIPPDLTDPLYLNGLDDAAYEAMLTSPVKRTQKKQKKNKKRKNNRTSSGPGSGKEDSIEGAKLDQTNPLPVEQKPENTEEDKKEIKSEVESATPAKEPPPGQPPKRHKPEGHNNNNRANLRKMELKERKFDLDKIVSPVIPQPGAWNDRHRFRPPPQRTSQFNKGQVMPKFKESNSRFQYGNYNRYYGYRNPNQSPDVRLKVLERHKDLFRDKDVLDIGCNTGHLTLAIARDFKPNKVVGVDIDKVLIKVARTNIRHYVNCGKKDKFFPVSMPIVYGPIDIPGVREDKAFPHNISFIQGNYVLESDVLLSMEQPQFDVILCLSITKWIQLNWGDVGLKRAFKRMFAQLRPGGVLILEAQSWSSYQRKKQLTPEIWKNFHSIELFPHQFNQYLLSEVGFSKCETMGSSLHQSRGFQRPIKLFIKEDPSFDTPVYSACTSVHESATPKYYRDNIGRLPNYALNSDRYSFRLPDSVHFPLDEFSGDSSFAYGTPSSYNSPESGFSESLHNPRRFPPTVEPMDEAANLEEAGSSQILRESQTDTPSTSEESIPMSAGKYESLGEEDNTVLSLDSNSQEARVHANEDRCDNYKIKEKETEIEDTIDESEVSDRPDKEQSERETVTICSAILDIKSDRHQVENSEMGDNTLLSDSKEISDSLEITVSEMLKPKEEELTDNSEKDLICQEQVETLEVVKSKDQLMCDENNSCGIDKEEN